ncbi:MAG: hypothetical protein BHW50_06205 [Ruminococcus bicirculans (ex Wegman et al. 2014)]|nr:MAG: hypothetical protein BHW50_06205 [Ruminococcus bicirculans (ex Wegman et al. 2014)]
MYTVKKMSGCFSSRSTISFFITVVEFTEIFSQGHMIPGWTHNIINLSDTEDLVTVMTCNEIFDPSHPDTFGEPV